MPIAAIGSLIGTHLTNKANKKISQREMAFQERMSNTAYQRGMKDMQEAGLNPILAGKMGGASSPPGAGIRSASYAQDYANVANVMANTDKTEEETKILKETSGSFMFKTLKAAKDFIVKHSSNTTGLIDKAKQKLKDDTAKNNTNKKKLLRLKITRENLPNNSNNKK
jgi:hypothetical protein